MTEKIHRMNIEIPSGSQITVYGADNGDDLKTEWKQTFTLTKPLVVWMESEAEGTLVEKVYLNKKPNG